MAQQLQRTQAKNNSAVNRRAAQKKKRAIIVSIVSVILVIAVIITIVVVAKKNNMPESTRITTYDVDEVTYGNVSTTISGSGTLSPITKETLTLAGCILVDDSSDSTNTDTSSSDTSGDAQAQSATSGTGSVSSTISTTPVVIGTVGSIQVTVGDTLAKDAVIATVTHTDGTTTTDIVAPYDCVILEFYLSDADEVTIESEVAMLMGTDGYSMTISVDETNISAVELEQEVDITVDAVSGDYTGKVADISYNGSTSGSTTAYGITVTFDYIEGTYPGMSVSAEIVIEDSGDGLLVPVDAVYTSGNTKYVYLAPSGATLGQTYDEGELDTAKLTRVTVTEGMSDGTYVMIESSQLKEGDLIVITTVTSTLTGSDSENNGGGRGDFGGGMGNFGGGGGGGFPGGEMPEGFDPSNMPSFGGFGG